MLREIAADKKRISPSKAAYIVYLLENNESTQLTEVVEKEYNILTAAKVFAFIYFIDNDYWFEDTIKGTTYNLDDWLTKWASDTKNAAQ